MYIKLLVGRYFAKQLYYADKVYQVEDKEGAYLLSKTKVDGKPFFRQMIPKAREVEVEEPAKTIRKKPGPKPKVKKVSPVDEKGVVDEQPFITPDTKGVVEEENFDDKATAYEESEVEEKTEEFDLNDPEGSYDPEATDIEV